ncbi:hypothetical protein [Nocardia sp. CDC160]|uniref:hypothetical protein n=1 Tax=Nocardia sp. CDC160 TaxID=3112166 RepID=UPI002DB8782A|nr:hypothetical protein [Nocardia sp. CDC160]MEC3919231.1 hypothetical protein [Nocardia sp. CDC160]
MGVYLSAYIADWPRLAAELSRVRAGASDRKRWRAGDASVGHFPLGWDRDGWGVKARFPDNGWPLYKPHREFQEIWSEVIECLQGEHDERWDKSLLWDDLINDTDEFIDGVFGGGIAVDPEEAARWASCTEIIAAYAWLAHSPAHVTTLAQVWRRLSGKTGELRPYIEPQFDSDSRFISRFEEFEQHLHCWAVIVEQAHQLQWGLVIALG